MSRTTSLGEYLRARRELVHPKDVGLPSFGRRRVPGLRREELAILAGISADYYLRLEQGRDRHPSAQVLDALARALRLDEDATAHLHSLARPAANGPRQEPERAPSSIEQLIVAWSATPAFVIGRRMDVLAANALASALSTALRPGVNLVRATFLDMDVRKLMGDSWEERARTIVARLRSQVGPHVDDPLLHDLVADLSARSDRFRQLWARHDVKVVASPARIFNHPLVGPIELLHDFLTIAGTEELRLSVYHAVPGSSSERALRRLANLASRNHAGGKKRGLRTTLASRKTRSQGR